MVLGIGCYNMALLNFNLDMSHALHGRAPAVATGIKRTLPENIVLTMDELAASLEETLPAHRHDMIEVNRQALQKGMDAVSDAAPWEMPA